jgi:hypothetical protein
MKTKPKRRKWVTLKYEKVDDFLTDMYLLWNIAQKKKKSLKVKVDMVEDK